MDKINLIHIVSNHLKTLRNINSGKISTWDMFIFFAFPFIVSLGMTINNITIQSIIGDLLKAIAIFSAFLFNMLAIVNNSFDREKVKNNKLKSMYAKEIHTNLSFEILLGVTLVFFLIVQSIVTQMPSLPDFYNLDYWLKKIIETINISLLGTFLLTLLMCLNRVYILIKY